MLRRRFHNKTKINVVQPSVKQIKQKQFSIIIPTMWCTDMLFTMLDIYEKSPHVGEVILIDNAPEKKPDLYKYNKVKYYTKGENIYVEPAWNWGASIAQHELIFANDDIIINNLDSVLSTIIISKYDIVGIDLNGSGQLRIEEIDKFPGKGYGCFLYVKKYYYIPEQFKIWYADDMLFKFSEKRGIIKGAYVTTIINTTVDSDPSFRKVVCKKDTDHFNNLPTKEEFNIIIRTSGRPNYFKYCINSIRNIYPEARLHITIDDIEDLKYVEDNVKDFKYNYYLIDKEKIQGLVKNTQIKTRPFVYNHYFNVVRPFLKGWCMFIDDDDELLIKPKIKDSKDTVHLYKADIRDMVVPSNANFGKQAVLNDISGLCIVFHSSKMIEWTPQRGGDYVFIKGMKNTNSVVWVDKIISRTQTGSNFGQRNDLCEKAKIAICIPFWKRPKITKFVFDYYNRLKKELEDKVELVLIACGSEGEESKRLAEDSGFIYIEHTNSQFLEKHNVMYMKAREYNVDACLKIDSDSIVSKEFFYYYTDLINKGVDYSGILDIYLLIKDKLCYWSGYTNHRIGESHGVGKFMSKNLLDKINWRPFGDSKDMYPDRVFHNIQKHLDIKRESVTCKQLNGFCIDIKSNEQLTAFHAFTFDYILPLNINVGFSEIQDELLDPQTTNLQ